MSTAARRIGRYALYDAIGSGGMATVHLGRLFGPRGFARIVAIKRLHAAYAEDADFTARFMQEARLASRIRHPNVVPVLDVVAEGGELSLVMDYVEGESLARLLRAARERGETVPIGIAAAIVSGLLHGLHAAHASTGEDGQPLGVVHRDVSPQNVIVGADGVARLLDFGVAKAIGLAPVTRGSGTLGKLAYMAPEQVRRERLTAATDVYAASVVLWEMTCGRRLFRGEEEADVAEQVLIGLVPPASKFVPGIDDALEKIIASGISSHAEDRPRAHDMALALEPFAATRGAIATWVAGLASDAIAQRAALVRSVEQAPSPAADTPPAPRRSRRGLWLGGAVLCLVAGYAGLSAHGRGAAPAPVAAVSATAIAAEPSPPPREEPRAAVPEAAAPIVTAAPRPRPAAVRDAAPRPSPSPSPSPSAPRCERIDPATGDIIFDRACR